MEPILIIKFVLLAVIFISVFVFIYSILISNINRKELIVRLQKLDISDNGISVDEIDMTQSIYERIISPFFKKAGLVFIKYTPRGFSERISRKLQSAGYKKSDPLPFLGIKICSSILFLFIFIIFGYISGLTINNFISFSSIFLFSGYLLPDFVLNNMSKKYKQSIYQSLPNLLDLLTVSVQSGLGLEQALLHSSEKLKGPISKEIDRTLQEIRLGKKRSDSLRSFAERIPLDDIKSFCTAIIQAEQLGTSISNVLRIQSDFIRLKRSQIAEQAAMKAPLKLLFPLVFFIFPALFIILIGPAFIKIMAAFSSM